MKRLVDFVLEILTLKVCDPYYLDNLKIYHKGSLILTNPNQNMSEDLKYIKKNFITLNKQKYLPC